MPSDSLVQRTGFSSETLEAHHVLPQLFSEAPSGYALVVARRDSICVKEFRACGIPVFVGSAEEIRQTWEQYRIDRCSGSLAPEIQDVLKRIAVDAEKLGATEVFLGHPSEGAYELVSRGRIFSGAVHPRVFQDTFRHLRHNTPLTFEVQEDRIRRVTAAITKNFEREIICLSCDVERAGGLMERQKESGKRIVFVEDDDRFSTVTAQLLRAKGFLVQLFTDAAPAFDYLLSSSPDLILCDVNLPTMDGRSFLTALRTKGLKVPVIMLTGDDEPLLEAELALRGVNAFVGKHRDPRVLLAWIHNLTRDARLYRHRKETQ